MEQALAIVAALQVLTLLGLVWVLARLERSQTTVNTEINLDQRYECVEDADEVDWWKHPRPNPDDED